MVTAPRLQQPLVFCEECRQGITLQEWEDCGHICETCLMAHYAEAEEVLYGPERVCDGCQQPLSLAQDQDNPWCERCDPARPGDDPDERLDPDGWDG